MTTPNLEAFRQLGLTPYQAELAMLVARSEPRVPRFLKAAAGTGKGFMALRLIEYLFSEGIGHRILLLGPAALVSTYRNQLSEATIPAPILTLDRRRFRELQAEVAPTAPIWPERCLVITSIDFAKAEDVAEELVRTPWDLVVVDEAGSLGGKRSKLVERILDTGAAVRLLFMSRTVPLDFLERRPEIEVYRWPAWQDVTDWDGGSVGRRTVSYHAVSYRRRPDEVEFLRAVERLVKAMRVVAEPSAGFVANVIENRASSSLYSLEKTLRRMQHQVARTHTIEVDGEDPFLDASVDEETPPGGTRPGSTPAAFFPATNELLEQLETVSGDAKIETLLAVAAERDLQVKPRATLVLTAYRDTAEYVTIALTEVGRHVALVHAASTQNDWSTAREILADGGYVVSTAVAMKGARLDEVDHGVFFDLPWTEQMLATWQALFPMAESLEPLEMYAFVDQSDVLPFERDRLQRAGFVERGLVGGA